MRSACSASRSAATRRAGGAARACTSCPRSGWAAARCRRCRWRRTPCSRAPRPSGASAGSTSGAPTALARHLLERYNVKAGGAARAGAQPVRRQPAEVHRRPRDRRRAEAADRVAADLGRRRRRRGADPRRAARAARRRLRGAGGQRGSRRAVRDLRPPRRDRARPRVAARSPAAQATREQVGRWMSGLWNDERRGRGAHAAA